MAEFTAAPQGRAPNLERLLTPGEKLLYTAKFHPFRGWQALVPALACFGASYYYPLAILPFLLLVGLWYLPLYTNEVAVTNNRLLLRTGWLKLMLEAVEDESLIRWNLEQNAVGSLFDAGTIRIRVREVASTREVLLKWVWHPVTLLEALQAMQDEKYRDAANGN